MKRIVWVAVAILIMIGILGYGLFTLRHIEEVNQKRREKQAGEKFAATVMMTTATTSIWDKVREGQETTSTETGAAVQETFADGDVPQTVTESPESPEGEFVPNEMDTPSTETSAETITVVVN